MPSISARLLLRFLSIAAALVFAGGVAANTTNEWSIVDGPTTGPARAIGGFSHGCLAGGTKLPDEGPGYEAIRLSRHRDFGHPDLIAFIKRLGRGAQSAGLPLFYVGDMAQARGGSLPYGHASHQTGLDVDIWFTLEPRSPLPVAAREDVDLPSMLRADHRDVDANRFGRRQITLLRLAANDPNVDRIFVNPVIKMALCRRVSQSDHGWLHRLRPWYGHDEHFHVRLKCPADSPDCETQAPLPDGDGCDATLRWWFDRPPPQPREATERPPRPTPPAACRAVLTSP
jgi:penicillin-insensitive murein endopeptidase